MAVRRQRNCTLPDKISRVVNQSSREVEAVTYSTIYSRSGTTSVILSAGLGPILAKHYRHCSGSTQLSMVGVLIELSPASL